MARISALLLLGAAAPAAAMQLGVNTHFDQGWPIAAMDQVRASGAQGIRDTISWGKVEQTPGRYTFTPANSGFAEQACARKLPLLLTLTPRNKVYDDGETVYSPAGRQAFAAFARAVADRYPCLQAIEIGNEINDHSLKGRMLQQMPQAYVDIVAAVRAALKPGHADVALLSGSSLSVASGFFARLFSAGLLPLVDGIVVHPYVATPEQLPAQMARLDAAMDKAGGRKPVWATEFGYSPPDAGAVPDYALKMVTLMSAAGIVRADWYALRDEPFFPNSGLFAGQQPRPELDGFRTSLAQLLARGDAKRIDQDSALVFAYRFGTDTYVVWGADRSIGWSGAAKAWDSQGKPIALPQRLTDRPVIVQTAGSFVPGAPTVVTDSLTDFASPSWRYAVDAGSGAPIPLGWIDWNWAPYLGAASRPNFRAMPNAVSLGGRPGAALQLVEHYADAGVGTRWLSACFETPAAKPGQVTIRAGGKTLYSASIAGQVRTDPIPLPAGARDVEIGYAGAGSGGVQIVKRRVRILAEPLSTPALCVPGGGREDGT